MTKRTKSYEIVEDGNDFIHYKKFGSLRAARAFIVRQMKPLARGHVGWKLIWLNAGRNRFIRHIPSGKVYSADPVTKEYDDAL